MGFTVLNSGTAVATAGSRTIGPVSVDAYASVAIFVAAPLFATEVYVGWYTAVVGGQAVDSQSLKIVPENYGGFYLVLPVLAPALSVLLSYPDGGTHAMTWWIAGSTLSAPSMPPSPGPFIHTATGTIPPNSSTTDIPATLYEGLAQVDYVITTPSAMPAKVEANEAGGTWRELQTGVVSAERLTLATYLPFLPIRLTLTNPTNAALDYSVVVVAARAALAG